MDRCVEYIGRVKQRFLNLVLGISSLNLCNLISAQCPRQGTLLVATAFVFTSHKLKSLAVTCTSRSKSVCR